MSLTPRTNPDLVGHAAAETALLQAWRSGRLHHAWLITGAQGIGKATLAWRFARFLLAHGLAPAPAGQAATDNLYLLPEHPIFRRVVAGGHADIIDIAPNEKGNLGVDEVRKIEPLFRRSAAEGGWRIAIIEDADAMTEPAQNALLKILEEPPPGAILLLTAQVAGRLLPTIRSRVRTLHLEPLPAADLAAMLEKELPTLTAPARAELAALAGGSIGQALALSAAEGVQAYRELLVLIDEIHTLPAQPLLDYAEKLGRKGGEAAYAVIADLLPEYLENVARLAASGEMTERLPGEGAVAAALAQRLGLEPALALWDKVREQFRQAAGLNLDRKQTLLSVLLTVKEAAA